jgi:hypothetical protein
MVHAPSTLSGISAIKKNIENQTKFNQAQISTAFQDLDSLKEKARNLVGVANTIRNKIERKEMTADSEEMKEIQQVMFNMGLVNDFSSQVTKLVLFSDEFIGTLLGRIIIQSWLWKLKILHSLC